MKTLCGDEGNSRFLKEEDIQKILERFTPLAQFWRQDNPLLIFRNTPSLQDPVYEIQMAWDLGDRVETYGWVWVDAWKGCLLKMYPEH